MSTGTPRRIFGRTSLALAGAAVLAPVVGFLTIQHDWATRDMTLELMAEGFVVTLFAVVAAGYFALCAWIAGGISLARNEPDRWAGGIGLALGGLSVAQCWPSPRSSIRPPAWDRRARIRSQCQSIHPNPSRLTCPGRWRSESLLDRRHCNGQVTTAFRLFEAGSMRPT